MPSPLPTAPPFDLCFVSGTALASLFTYTGVTYGGDLAQFTVGAAAVTLGCLASLLLLIAILRAIGMPQRAPRFIKDAALILFPVSSHPRIGRH